MRSVSFEEAGRGVGGVVEDDDVTTVESFVVCRNEVVAAQIHRGPEDQVVELEDEEDIQREQQQVDERSTVTSTRSSGYHSFRARRYEVFSK